MLLLLSALSLLTATPVREGDHYRVGDQGLSLAIDAATGAWTELRVGQDVIATDQAKEVPLDFKVDDTWVVGQAHTVFRLAGIETDGSTTVTTLTAPGWRVRINYRLEPATLSLARFAEVTSLAAETHKLRGLWLRTPKFTMAKEGGWFAPGDYPPQWHSGADLQPGRKQNWGRSVAPLVVQLGPQRSLLLLSDELTPRSDRPSVGVTEEDGAIWCGQGFNALGYLKPNEPQAVGDAWLRIVQSDAEGALRQIHTWMREVGEVVPHDRPAWFHDAVLYAMHPGGTIGGRFHDLGGFKAATPFLETVADLGCTSVWFLPIEDASPYHPRDYYKFQQGLGTPEEYRALVAHGHELGLKMIQDIVPHGGSNTYPRAKEHPEWLAREEDGSTLGYWCFDFGWPGWQQYMAKVASYYVKTFGIEGYRVDACGGSKIPNWNPEIPYARASFAQLQGGLGMLRGLRAAVKAEQPRDGGLLAEVQGSVYGTVSDCVYDFTACYNVFHDLRRQPADVFVNRLRRWLHEQQYAEAADLLRLRHPESHDSLRSELWYGVDGQRAMMALSSWIQGVPLVYQEGETGSRRVFQRIFGLRAALPELRVGAADYVSVIAPPAVFACLRTLDDQASVALINFDDQPLDAELRIPADALPEKLRGKLQLRDTWRDEPVQGTASKFTVPLAPLGFTVVTLRTGQAEKLPAEPQPWPTAQPQPLAARSDVILAGRTWRAELDPMTGLIGRFESGGKVVSTRCDLYTAPPSRPVGPALVQRERDGVVAERDYGGWQLKLTYLTSGDRLRIKAETAGRAPSFVGLTIPFEGATRWYAATPGGVWDDDYLVRHLTTDGEASSIYYRPQGTATIWDSALHPLGPGPASLGALANGATTGLAFTTSGLPDRAEWLDRIGDDHRLTALLTLTGPTTFELVPGLAPQRPTVPGLQRVAGGWEYENEHYRLRLDGGGILARLEAKQPHRVIVAGGDLYTDHGFANDRTRYGAGNDVEVWSRVDQQEDGLHLTFNGRLRGMYRFDLLNPPVEYHLEYVLSDGPSFRFSSAVRPAAATRGDSVFLALQTQIPALRTLHYVLPGGRTVDAAIGDGKQRALQTIDLDPPVTPTAVRFDGADGTLLQLDELTTSGAPLRNLFAHNTAFYSCWLDREPVPGPIGRWRQQSAVWTPGGAQPMLLGTPPTLGEDKETPLLRDGGFESALAAQPAGLVSGRRLPRPSDGSVWTIPAGGSLVAAPVKSGAGAAEVDIQNGSYALFRQSLDVAQFPAQSTWRLTAQVKGENIVQGDVSWKVGCVRFGVLTDKMQYVTSPSLTDTFDWREVSVELAVPEGLQQLSVEAGLNGANGKIWIDELKLERLP